MPAGNQFNEILGEKPACMLPSNRQILEHTEAHACERINLYNTPLSPIGNDMDSSLSEQDHVVSQDRKNVSAPAN